MAAYKDRVRADIDRWIEAGLVAPDKREAILASIPDARRLDAATAMAWVGAVLLGIAAIAFVAANWDALPRLARFALVLTVFAAAAGAGAWAAHKQKPLLTNLALTLAALLFAAAIGLTGQIFDIVGAPRAALYGSGVAAATLALAGRSSGAAIASLLFIGLADFHELEWFASSNWEAPWLIVAGPLGAALALRWSSAPLAHASAIGVIVSFGWFAAHHENEASLHLLFSMMLAALAAGARWLFLQGRAHASAFYGWFAWAAFMFFAAAGLVDKFESDADTWAIPHRLAWLAGAGATIALGRFDRHALVTTIGVLAFIGAVSALMMDLGLDLMTAAAVFFACALVALGVGLMLRRKKAAPS